VAHFVFKSQIFVTKGRSFEWYSGSPLLSVRSVSNSVERAISDWHYFSRSYCYRVWWAIGNLASSCRPSVWLSACLSSV